MSELGTIQIELVFATADKQVLRPLRVPAGKPAREALAESGLAAEFTDCDFAICPIGIWGKPVADYYALQNGDRLEVYRPLRHDPREFRRELASQGRSMGAAGVKDQD